MSQKRHRFTKMKSSQHKQIHMTDRDIVLAGMTNVARKKPKVKDPQLTGRTVTEINFRVNIRFEHYQPIHADISMIQHLIITMMMSWLHLVHECVCVSICVCVFVSCNTL